VGALALTWRTRLKPVLRLKHAKAWRRMYSLNTPAHLGIVVDDEHGPARGGAC